MKKSIRSSLLLAALVFAFPALAVDYAPTLTWEHSGTDVDGDPILVNQWRVEFSYTGSVDQMPGSPQHLNDSDGSLRSWDLDPVTLEFDTTYQVRLYATHCPAPVTYAADGSCNNGVLSAPATALVEIEAIGEPEAPTGMIINIDCPSPCIVNVNGVPQ